MTTDLKKILRLLKAQQRETTELGFLLFCNQKMELNPVYAPVLKEILDQLSWHFNYFLHEEDSNSVALEKFELLTSWAKHSYQVLHPFDLEELFWLTLSKHILAHYPEALADRGPWDILVASLFLLIPVADALCLLSYSGREDLIVSYRPLWKQLDHLEIENQAFRLWRTWLKEFKSWNVRLKNAESREKHLRPFIQNIKTYLQNISKVPLVALEVIKDLWNTLGRLFANSLEDEFILVLELALFSQEQRQEVLLRHPIFEFSERHMEQIGGMPPDDEYNLYDLLEEDVAAYANYFNTHLTLLRDLNSEQLQYLKERIYEAWSFFYLAELLPYLEFIQEQDTEDPHVYFYLAQAKVLAGKELIAIDYYMRYISLAPLEIPNNHFFISEMHYNTRTYAPSVLEAINHIGYLHQHILNNEERAIYYYEQSIKLRPDHHQAGYWEMIKILIQKNNYGGKLLHYLLQYVDIVFEQTAWLNPKDSVYNIIVDIDKDRREAIAWKEQLAIYDPDFKRQFGYDFLKTFLLSLLWELAEHFWEAGNYKASFKATVKAKQLFKNHKIRSLKPTKAIKQPFAYYEVNWEDILYLQAINILKLERDYWQARSLLKQVLKKAPTHQGARASLQIIKNQLGY